MSKSKITKVGLLVAGIFLVWQFTSLFLWRFEQLYPTGKTEKVARNQLFIFDSRWSFLPGSISGCLYFPNLYDSEGSRIQTAGGSIGKQFMEPDRHNNVLLEEGWVVDLKVRAECGVGVPGGIVPLYKLNVFEKRYLVGETMLTGEERVSIFRMFSDLPPEIISEMVKL